MRIASQALAIERQASAQSALAERVSKPKTRAILGFMRLNFLSVFAKEVDVLRNFPVSDTSEVVIKVGQNHASSQSHVKDRE